MNEQTPVHIRLDTTLDGTYGRYFDHSSHQWVNDTHYNRAFLKWSEEHLNDVLRVRGFVFLNEVYERLGFDYTVIGAICGWVRDEGRIDFGLDSQKVTTEPIFLDFNVQGIIFDKIERRPS